MPPKGFTCRLCGDCCRLLDAFDTCATEEDIRLWKNKGRRDILEWVNPIHCGGDEYVFDIWISPKTGDYVTRCPWLRKVPNRDNYICRIHDVKPEHCREFPKSREHAEKEGCRGFEKE